MPKEKTIPKLETPKKSGKGKGMIKGNNGGIPFGDPRNPSPSGAAKSAGWARKRTGMELAKAILALTFNDVPIQPFLKQRVAEFYNISEEDVTVESVLHFQQIKKASTGDTY